MGDVPAEGPTAVRDAGFAEESLPRSNGALVFDAPWQARAHAMAVLAVEGTGRDWDDFRRELIAALAEDPARPYWESWVVALGAFAAACGIEEHGERVSTSADGGGP